MDKNIKIALILSATDRMSSVVNSATMKANAKLKSMSDRAFTSGRGMMAAGVAAGASLYAPIKAFADLEDAGLRLKSVMMRDGGVVPEALFKKMNDQAIVLGNKLPGTTADFQNLYATMIEQGTPAKVILDGVGESAAYLAVQLKMPTEQAGILASRLRLQMGIASKDMMGFMDVMSRIKNVGVDPTEMQYAFGRSAGAMKLLNVQGLAASKTLGTLYAMLIREGGATGETAGTGVSKIMNELLNPTKMAKFNAAAKSAGLSFQFFKNGKFLGLENFVAQLTKFQGMDPEKITKILMPLTGGEGMDNQFIASLSKMGASGFNNMSKELANQATLQKKVDLMLNSLTNIWEATVGTITNTMAAFAATFAPSLKLYSKLMGGAAEKLQMFIKAHPVFFKYVGLAVMLFATVAIAAGSVSFVFGGVMRSIMVLSPMFKGIGIVLRLLLNPIGTFIKLFGLLSKVFMFGITVINKVAAAFMYASKVLMIAGRFMMANPIILIIMAIAIAAFLIYKYWDKIKPFFIKLWANVKEIFFKVVDWAKFLFLNFTPYGLIFKHWDKISAFFMLLWESVKRIFFKAVSWFIGLHIAFFNAGKNIVTSIWNGIKAMANKPVEAIKAIMTKVRAFLPFSPAKVGPLRDIHRIRLIETIAGSIKSAPLLNAMKNVTYDVSRYKGPSRPGGSSGSGAVIHFSPQIHLSGGATTADANMITSEMKRQFESMMKTYFNQKERTKF